MIKLSDAIDKFIYKWGVDHMLDPESELYIPKITMETVAKMCDNDDTKTEMFWLCFQHAYQMWRKQQAEQEALEEMRKAFEIPDEVYHNPNACPECGYAYYQGYVKCPNCDYQA